MKKIVLAVAVVLLLVVLASCTTESVDSLLRRKWDENVDDILNYDVYDAAGNDRERVGGMTVKMRYYSNTTAQKAFGGEALTGFTGNYTSFEIDAAVERDGETVGIEIRSEAFFSGGTGMKPVYSYKKVTENGGLVYEIVGNYRDKDYEYRLTDKNGEKSGKIKLSGTYFDNEMIFALVRACPLDDRGTNLNFSFNVPSVLDDGAGLTAMKVVNAAGNAVAYQKKSAKDGELSESDYIFAENALHFSYTSAKGKGGGLEMYYLKTDDFKFAGQPTHIPVKIKQNGLEYIFVVNP